MRWSLLKWRGGAQRQTHFTFHWAIEATITLEDVAYIYSLPIDGPLVAGHTFLGKLVAPVVRSLGLPHRRSLTYVGIKVKFEWLEDNFKVTELTKKKKDKKYKELEIRATRVYLFFLVSGQIVMQTFGAHGPTYLLELFKEFKPYVWAPACLTNLYRMLINVTRWNAEKKIDEEENDDYKGEDEGHHRRTPTGPLQLLQVIVIITNIIWLTNYIVRNPLSFMRWCSCGLTWGCWLESVLNQR